MKSIITITLNPAIDKSIFVPFLIENQKLKCTETKSETGGGGINVSRAIKKLGGTSTAWFLAGGYYGAFFTNLFKRKKIDFNAFPIKNETRESLIAFDESTSKQYLLDIKGPVVFKNEWENILVKLAKLKKIDFIVASGSLPQGIPTDFYARIAKICQKINAKFILDTAGIPLQLAINEGVYLIKPNLKEMGILAGIDGISIDQARDKALEIIQAKKCEVIVISLGAEGALLVAEGHTAHFKAPKIDVKSTVGAGDSMLAAIVLKLAKHKNLQEAVRYGVAAGAAATLRAGTTLCNKKDTDTLFKESEISK